MTKFAIHGHKAGKTGHKVLAHLRDQGEAGMHALMNAAAVDPASARGRKFGRLLHAMRRDGLIFASTDGYILTQAGRDALALLDAGGEVQHSRPSVRVFA